MNAPESNPPTDPAFASVHVWLWPGLKFVSPPVIYLDRHRREVWRSPSPTHSRSRDQIRSPPSPRRRLWSTRTSSSRSTSGSSSKARPPSHHRPAKYLAGIHHDVPINRPRRASVSLPLPKRRRRSRKSIPDRDCPGRNRRRTGIRVRPVQRQHVCADLRQRRSRPDHPVIDDDVPAAGIKPQPEARPVHAQSQREHIVG